MRSQTSPLGLAHQELSGSIFVDFGYPLWARNSNFTVLFTCEGPLCAGISAFWALAAPRAGTVGSSEARMVVFDSP